MNEAIVEIKEGDLVFARHIPAAVAWKAGLDFFSQHSDFIQVGVWGYDSQKKLKDHIHNQVKRETLWTQEVLFVRKGKLLANIFNTNGKKVAELEINSGDIIILLQGGHGYEILESGTQVLEVKNGPYVGPDMDRRRL